MEAIKVTINDRDEYDRIVHGGVPERGDLRLASKNDATEGGRPAVVIGFTAVVDGKDVPVQAVTTLANLEMAVQAFCAGNSRVVH